MTAGSVPTEQPASPTQVQPEARDQAVYDAPAGFDINEMLSEPEPASEEAHQQLAEIEQPPVVPSAEVPPAIVEQAEQPIEAVMTTVPPVQVEAQAPIVATPEVLPPVATPEALTTHVESRLLEAEALVQQAYSDKALLPKVAAVMTQLRHENSSHPPVN
jgi:hypothetical protein